MEKTRRFTVRMPPDLYEAMQRHLAQDTSKTQAQFINNAVRMYVGYLNGRTTAARFYLGYIKARETEDYLSKTLLSIISARQERSDKATVSVLYALAVELNILQRILVSHFDIPDEVYAELRRKARAEVAVSRKGAQIESVQAQMFGGDTGWQSSSQNGAI